MSIQVHDETRSLEPLTDLLKAHAALIVETSDSMALQLSKGLEDLTEAMADGNSSGRSRAERMSGLLSALQLQDVLRQQAVVLISGLDAVSKAHVPANEKPEDWYLERMKEIEAAYVMQAQYEVHAKLLGDEVATQHQQVAANDTMFF